MDDLLKEVGSFGNYWTATIDSETPTYAWYMVFKMDKGQGELSSSRYYGHSIRPVTEL